MTVLLISLFVQPNLLQKRLWLNMTVTRVFKAGRCWLHSADALALLVVGVALTVLEVVYRAFTAGGVERRASFVRRRQKVFLKNFLVVSGCANDIFDWA